MEEGEGKGLSQTERIFLGAEVIGITRVLVSVKTSLHYDSQHLQLVSSVPYNRGKCAKLRDLKVGNDHLFLAQSSALSPLATIYIPTYNPIDSRLLLFTIPSAKAIVVQTSKSSKQWSSQCHEPFREDYWHTEIQSWYRRETIGCRIEIVETEDTTR